MQASKEEIVLPYTTMVRQRIVQMLSLKSDSERTPNSMLEEAMVYTCTRAGAKMLRPNLFLLGVKLCNSNHVEFLDISCAIELIHQYSLVHDDLPCMDNASTRRGEQTVHKRFKENIAVLTGDALLTMAFSKVADCSAKDKIKTRAISCLAKNIGASGMLLGQDIDLNFNGTPSEEVILLMHRLKAGHLIASAMELSGIVTEQTDEVTQILGEIGMLIGLLIQAADDLKDQNQDERMNIAKLKGTEYVQKLMSKYIADIEIRMNAMHKMFGIRWNEVNSDARMAKEYIIQICNWLMH